MITTGDRYRMLNVLVLMCNSRVTAESLALNALTELRTADSFLGTCPYVTRIQDAFGICWWVRPEQRAQLEKERDELLRQLEAANVAG